MREDTRPETPYAKGNSDAPPALDRWQRPTGRDPARDALFGMSGGGARLDWGFGGGKVRTFHASGPAAVVLAIVVLLAIGALISLFFVFAVGIGTALALGAGAAGALGLGANMLRRRLPSGSHRELRPGDR